MKGISERDLPVDGTDTDARKQMREYLYHTLGGDFYLLCKNFFESIWRSGASYKVFFARRCMNLMYLFYLCADESVKCASLEETFFTDKALLSDVRGIARIYMETRTVPQILIADEILIHGRTLNDFITEFSSRLYDSVKEAGGEPELQELEAAVCSAVQIRVIIQDDGGLLLYSRYRTLVRADEVCPKWRWHQFLSAVSQAIAKGGVTNTSYVPSLNADRCVDRGGLYQYLAGQADRMMTVIPYRRRFLEKAWAYPVVSPSGGVYAVYTLRAVTCEADGSRVLIPLVLFPDIREFRDVFLDYLDGGARTVAEDALSYWGDGSPAAIEALVMMLSQNLLLLLLEGRGGSGWKDGMDYGKIKMSFNSRHSREAGFFFSMVADRERPWFTWGEMDRLLLEMTVDTRPLFSLGRDTDVHVRDGFVNEQLFNLVEEKVGDLLSDHGFSSERHAYRQLIGEEFPHGRNVPCKSLTRVLDELSRDIGHGVPGTLSGWEFLLCVTAALLRHMDMGALALTMAYSRRDGAGAYRSLCRVGEQSLFIWPQRYSVYLPVLAMMERDCREDPERLICRVREFFASRTGGRTAERLALLVKKIYEAGQCVQDWDIDLSGWLEWDLEGKAWDDMPMELGEIRKLNTKALISELAAQNRLLGQYMES